MYLIFLARQRNFFISGGPNISYHSLSPPFITNELHKKIETIRKGLTYSYHGVRHVFRTHFFLGGGIPGFFLGGEGDEQKEISLPRIFNFTQGNMKISLILKISRACYPFPSLFTIFLQLYYYIIFFFFEDLQ